jgi:hypothetical protein
MIILAIDPGTTESAAIRWNGQVLGKAITPNAALLEWLRQTDRPDVLAVEMIQSFGMPVGSEVFETCLMIGRIQEIAHQRQIECRLIYRMAVKQHHCHTAQAKDANIRQALIDKYGPPGTKKKQGLTYGVASHLWSALAIATYVSETAENKLILTG